MTSIRSISIDDELWEKAKEQYGDRKVSEKIRQLIRKDLNENTDSKLPLDIVESSDLTNKQKHVVRSLIEKGVSEKNEAQWNNFIESQGIKRKDYKEKCHGAITQSDQIPYKSKGRQGVKSVEVQCRCDASVYVHQLSKTDGKCPNCDRRIVKINMEKNKVKA
jgi:hypothetical protein